jgi:hypothetical protein
VAGAAGGFAVVVWLPLGRVVVEGAVGGWDVPPPLFSALPSTSVITPSTTAITAMPISSRPAARAGRVPPAPGAVMASRSPIAPPSGSAAARPATVAIV